MSAADTVARMLTLVPWLLERPGASVGEVADAFGVSRATILSDLDTIGYCGLPGLGGGDLFEISVIEGRILVEIAHELRQPLRLSPREALRLVLAGEAVAAAVGEGLPALRSALDRVREAAGVPDRIEVQLEDEGTNWLSPLRRAIEERRQVTVMYRSRGAEAPGERTIDPWGLHVAQGLWYVQARDHRSGEVRTFRLDRIADLRVHDEGYGTPPDDVDLRPPRYEPGPDDVEVELMLGRDARWLAEAVLPDEVEDLDDGRRRVVFHTDAPAWVRTLVLGAAPGVEVVRPAQLDADVREEARRALARYE